MIMPIGVQDGRAALTVSPTPSSAACAVALVGLGAVEHLWEGLADHRRRARNGCAACREARQTDREVAPAMRRTFRYLRSALTTLSTCQDTGSAVPWDLLTVDQRVRVRVWAERNRRARDALDHGAAHHLRRVDHGRASEVALDGDPHCAAVREPLRDLGTAREGSGLQLTWAG